MLLFIILMVGLVIALIAPALLIRELDNDLDEKLKQLGARTYTRYEVHGRHFATYDEAKKYLDWVNEDTI